MGVAIFVEVGKRLYTPTLGRNHGGMAEETLNDSFPDLKEVENKVGRKTPESLLVWMRDAADCEDGWRSDVVDSTSAFSDSFSDKISNLKQEMRWLRSADVRILRQLVAVHEGIEAMRWLMEERGALGSHGSSLTGSLSSLVTVEEHGPSISPCRERLSPTETSGKEPADHPPHADDSDSNPKIYFDVLIPESTEGPASTGPANCGAKLQKSQPQVTDAAPLPDITNGAGTIRRALLRSNRARREVKADSFLQTKCSGETQTEQRTQESFRGSRKNTMEEEEPKRETALPGYDAQWCWVESQDDVTFL